VYGVGSANRFADVVRDQAKAYKAMPATYKAINAKLPLGSKRKPTIEEWQAIADLSMPPSAGIDRIEIIAPLEDDEAMGLAPVLDDADPSMELQNFLTENEVDPGLAAAVAEIYAAGEKLTKGRLGRIPALAHKPQQVVELLAVVKKWTPPANVIPKGDSTAAPDLNLLKVTAPTAAATIDADLAE
jgi:hypothetical protein